MQWPHLLVCIFHCVMLLAVGYLAANYEHCRHKEKCKVGREFNLQGWEEYSTPVYERRVDLGDFERCPRPCESATDWLAPHTAN